MHLPLVDYPFEDEDLWLYRCRPVELPLPSGKAIAAVRQTQRWFSADRKMKIGGWKKENVEMLSRAKEGKFAQWC